jgi:hypothetical protein
VVTTRTFGFKNALGSLGWFLLIFGSCMAGVAGMVGVEWYSFSSQAYMATAAVALVLMLLLNKPSFNIFANFNNSFFAPATVNGCFNFYLTNRISSESSNWHQCEHEAH